MVEKKIEAPKIEVTKVAEVEVPKVEVNETVVSVGKGKLAGLNVAQPNNEPDEDGYVGVDPVPVRSSKIDQP